MSPACFPPTVLLLDAPLPSAGSSRSSSPTSTVLSTRYDFLPPVSPHFVAFAWRYQGNTRDFAPIAAECHGDGPGVGCPVSPTGISSMETTGSPTFLGNPLCLCPALRPRQDRRVRPLATRRRGPRSDHDEGSRIATFEAQSHSFSTGCLRFAGWVTTATTPRHRQPLLSVHTTQDSLPVAGQALPDGIDYPLGSDERFQIHVMLLIPLSQTSWRKVRS
jgi:hypothetical protein